MIQTLERQNDRWAVRNVAAPRRTTSFIPSAFESSVDYNLSDSSAGVQLGKRKYLKELIHTGDFAKYDKDGNVEYTFSVDEDLINHWRDTIELMLADLGPDAIPMPLEHTRDPDKNRAYIHGAVVGKNSKGKTALYGIVDFIDDDAERLAKSTNVSIHVPPSVTRSVDGKTKTYIRPIAHVAFTNYPVIPGLDGFQTISASYVEDANLELGDNDMGSLTNLAQRLGIPTDSADDETSIEDKIVAVFISMRDRINAADERANAEDDALSADDMVNQQVPLEQLPSGVTASLSAQLAESRKTILGSLLGKHITKPVYDKLVARYASPEAISLSLSDDAHNKEFNDMVDTLRLNKCVSTESTTGRQSISLSDGGRSGREKSSLEVNAERRAEASKA